MSIPISKKIDELKSYFKKELTRLDANKLSPGLFEYLSQMHTRLGANVDAINAELGRLSQIAAHHAPPPLLNTPPNPAALTHKPCAKCNGAGQMRNAKTGRVFVGLDRQFCDCPNGQQGKAVYARIMGA